MVFGCTASFPQDQSVSSSMLGLPELHISHISPCRSDIVDMQIPVCGAIQVTLNI